MAGAFSIIIRASGFTNSGRLLKYYGWRLNRCARSAHKLTTINRTAIVVSPKQPFLDWLHRADPTSGELTLEDLRQEQTIYLLAECDNEKETRAYLARVCGKIFEEQFDAWYRVPSLWPKRRDLRAFDQWFEWSIHSTVVDLCSGPLLQEEM